MLKTKAVVIFLLLFSSRVFGADLTIGTELIQPGIQAVFLAKQSVPMSPDKHHLGVDHSDLSVVVRLNWSKNLEVSVPGDAPRGGFVPYAKVRVQITNVNSGKAVFAVLVPHVDMPNSFHYAINLGVPGGMNEKYDVSFFVDPPDKHEVSYHKDWRNARGDRLFGSQEYKYGNVSFANVSES